jgi:SH3-like domain-containing protein|tara:strand:+ start:20 stop:475 length:456 start_codon:yes stop_codon:yes gene_type:complete
MFKHLFFIKIFIIFFYFSLSIAKAGEIYLSLKKNKVNVRYGPSFESPIKFVYKKINLPIKQIDKKENFRRIIDFKNNSGWIHVSQLKNVNSIIPLTDKILFKKPNKFSKPLANIKKGRVLVVLKFDGNWCKVQSDKFKGWITSKDLWGKIN